MPDQLLSGVDRALKDYLLSKHQPEWLEQMGFGVLSLKDFLAQPEVRREPGLVKAMLAPLVGAADRDQGERDRMKADQMERDDTTWAGRYNEQHPPEYCSFNDFRMDPKYPTLSTAREWAMDWVTEVGPQILTLTAAPGRGKSHLSKAAWHFCEDRHRYPVWAPEGKLIRDLHAAIGAKTLEPLMEKLTTVPWLILDDLGRGSWNAFIKGTFDDIVNARHETEGLRTLISTNLAGEDLPPRMVSRLNDARRGRVLLIEAPDYRLTKR